MKARFRVVGGTQSSTSKSSSSALDASETTRSYSSASSAQRASAIRREIGSVLRQYLRGKLTAEQTNAVVGPLQLQYFRLVGRTISTNRCALTFRPTMDEGRQYDE